MSRTSSSIYSARNHIIESACLIESVFLQCGGCWAFSVVAAIEAVRVKDGGTLQDLSVQQVIDCDYKSQGCNGGSTVSALEWLKHVPQESFVTIIA